MPSRDATVIATYSRRMRLRFADGQAVDARIKGRKLKPVCGDIVSVEIIPDEDDWLITAVAPRRNELNRPNMRGKIETLAANIDLVAVVAATSPKPDWFIVDRYLCAAENMNAAAAVIFNKTDLEKSTACSSVLDTYTSLGYPCLACSAEADTDFGALTDLLATKIAIFAGQSGVGKSTLINRLTDASAQKTAAISTKTGEGRHTTVNSVMIALPNGGAVIDSPGVRDYAPALQTAAEAIHGFREVREAGERCRFGNCQHLREPNCAVKQAVDSGAIDPRRYESYRRTLALALRLSKEQRR